MVATTGLWMQRIAQDWLVLELTGSVTAVGIAVALQFLPVLLFGMWGGVLADRYPKRTLLIITQSLATLMAFTLGTLALSGAIQAWHVFVVAAALGFVTVVDNPTRQVFVSELVGPAHIRNAVSLNSSVFQLGALVGPAASGALISAVGQGWSFLLNAASCLVVVTMVAVIRPTSAPALAPSRPEGPAARRAALHPAHLRGGLVHRPGRDHRALRPQHAGHPGRLRRRRLLRRRRAATACSTPSPPWARSPAPSLSARRQHSPRLRSLTSSLVLLGVLLMVASLAPSIWVFGLVLVLIGFCTLQFLTGANSLVQTTCTPAVRGRVMSVYLMVLLGGQAIGGPTVGWLVDHIGARESMLACGAMVALVCTAAGLAMARRSHLTLEVTVRRGTGRLPVHIVPSDH